MRRAFPLFGTMLGWGVLAAASLPHAGFTHFVFDLTPWSFPVFALAIGQLYSTLTNDLPHLTKRHAFMIGYSWMFGYFLMGLSWVGNALLIDGNPYVWAYPFALIGLPFLLSFFAAVVFALAVPLLKRTNEVLRPLVFCALLTLAEYARGHLFTGFPWNLPAMMWSETLALFQSLSLIGPYGLSLLTLIWALGLYLLAGSWGRRALLSRPQALVTVIVALVTFGTALLFGISRQAALPDQSASSLQVVLVQASIPQAEKWDGEKLIDHFYTHLGLSDRPATLPDQPTVILWPETALAPSFIDSPVIQRAISTLLKTYPKGSALLTGALRQDGDAYYNSAVLFDQTGTPHIVYDKFHLVPFGEYMPLQNLIPIGPIARFEGLARGTGPKTVTSAAPIDLPPFSPLVCYEIIFPGQVTAHTEPDGPHPLWIANMTNDSWYGDSPGPYQHLAQAQARAIEEGLPVLRAAGNGVSAAINMNGQIVKKISYNEKTTLFVRIPLPKSARTLYHSNGDAPAIAQIIIILLLGVVRFRKLL